MNILSPDQLTAYKRKGWKVFQPGFDISYKSHWDTPWFFIREFFQNSLDEHDDAGISIPPTIKLSTKGLVIQDQGRGLGAESLLLRESKGEKDLRGRFGEGLKFACITAVRLGYIPVIESGSVIIRAYASPMTAGRIEANLLTFIYKEQNETRTGTTVTIEGYTGELYKDRFTTFLGKPIYSNPESVGRFDRREQIYTSPKGRLYVGDIYVRDLESPSDYSYNLWNLELNPDRISEIDNSAMRTAIAKLWANLTDKDLAVKALRAMEKRGSFESTAQWGNAYLQEEQEQKPAWVSAWESLYGKRAVLRSDPNLSRIAEAFGYKSVGEDFTYPVKSFLYYIVPTDKSIADLRAKELQKPKFILDKNLSKNAQTNLKLIRFLSEQCNRCTYGGNKPQILAATIPPDPRTGAQVSGLCSYSDGVIYLVPDVLEDEESTLSTFYHEMGHWAGGEDALDGTMEHTRAVQNAAALMSITFQVKRNEIDKILGIETVKKAEAVKAKKSTPHEDVTADVIVGNKEYFAYYRKVMQEMRGRGIVDPAQIMIKVIDDIKSGVLLQGGSTAFPDISYKPRMDK